MKRAGLEPQKVEASWFDPAQIGELEEGALRNDADEPYTRDNYTQQEFHELHDRQTKGQLENAVKMAEDLRKQADALEAAVKDANSEQPAQSSKPSHGFNLFA